MLKIAIIDDHKLFRKSLAMLTGTFDNVKVVAETDSLAEFLSILAVSHVDIVLLDIQMPDISGFDACKILLRKNSNLKILMISQLTTNETIRAVMDCGAHGFITKNSDPNQLQLALTNLNKNGFYLGAELGTALKNILGHESEAFPMPKEDSGVFTSREKQIIRMIAREMSSIEIANELDIHPRTAETHRTRIIAKTGAKNFIGVILYALRKKIIFLEDL